MAPHVAPHTKNKNASTTQVNTAHGAAVDDRNATCACACMPLSLYGQPPHRVSRPGDAMANTTANLSKARESRPLQCSRSTKHARPRQGRAYPVRERSPCFEAKAAFQRAKLVEVGPAPRPPGEQRTVTFPCTRSVCVRPRPAVFELPVGGKPNKKKHCCSYLWPYATACP